MNAPTVDRFRYPFRHVVPGETHPVFLHFVTPDDDPLDVSLSVFAVVMLDAFTATAAPGVVYTIDDSDAALGVIVATAPIPVDIDTGAMFEIRVRQDDETIIAGAPQFAPTVVPVTP
jgi:hypothetical protein